MGFLSSLFGASHQANDGTSIVGGGRVHVNGTSVAESLGLANQFTGKVEVDGKTINFQNGQIISPADAGVNYMVNGQGVPWNSAGQ